MKLYQYSKTKIAFLLCLLTLNACTTKRTGRSFYSQEIQCYLVQETETRQTPSPKNIDEFPAILKNRLSERSIHIAYAIGVTTMLEELILLESKENENEILLQRLKIGNQINIASMDISATAASLDCEEERADQIADVVENGERRRETRLTATAIGVGALTAIASGAILFANAQSPIVDVIGIAGGITEVFLGFSLLRIEEQVDYHHKINPLKSLLDGINHDGFFPPSVWYYLNHYQAGLPENLTVREKLLNIWVNAGQIPSIEQAEETIYFGRGGSYTSRQLRNRANMLDQTEAQINIMQNDLKTLMLEVNRD
jgi:hypothetical protein